MLRRITYILIMLSFSCGDGYDERMEKATKEFDKNTSEDQRKLVDNFFSGNFKYEDSKSPNIEGGFYCLWKRRDMSIKPHLALNERFIENGYSITTNSEKLKFIIINETISHVVGHYGDGGTASKLENVATIVDLDKSKYYLLFRNMGSNPPSSVTTKAGRQSIGIGSYLNDDQLYTRLTSFISK
ncbi:MAG: hypothetical protein CMP48_27560 [Rickettsiales bacterium]|nr:hypothetical protein [Rickettsiales bacterium]